MSDTDVVTPATNRERIIRVASSSDTNVIANIISKAIRDNLQPVLRAVGAAAVNQAVKAIAIARGHVAVRGLDLVVRCGFDSTTDLKRPAASGANEISCIVFRVSVSSFGGG